MTNSLWQSTNTTAAEAYSVYTLSADKELWAKGLITMFTLQEWIDAGRPVFYAAWHKSV